MNFCAKESLPEVVMQESVEQQYESCGPHHEHHDREHHRHLPGDGTPVNATNFVIALRY